MPELTWLILFQNCSLLCQRSEKSGKAIFFLLKFLIWKLWFCGVCLQTGYIAFDNFCHLYQTCVWAVRYSLNMQEMHQRMRARELKKLVEKGVSLEKWISKISHMWSHKTGNKWNFEHMSFWHHCKKNTLSFNLMSKPSSYSLYVLRYDHLCTTPQCKRGSGRVIWEINI